MSEEYLIRVEEKYKLSSQIEKYINLKLLHILDKNTSFKKIGFINLTDYWSALPLKNFTKNKKIKVIKQELKFFETFSFPKGIPTIDPLNLSYKKLLDTFKTLDLIFLQFPVGIRGIESLQFKFIKDNLKEDSLVILLCKDSIIKKFPKNYLDSDIFLSIVINLHQCYFPKTSEEIKAFILSKKKQKYVQLIETKNIINNYSMTSVEVGNIKNIIKDIKDRDLSKIYMSIPNNLNLDKIEKDINQDIFFSETNELNKYYEAVEFDIQKEKKIKIEGENYLGFDQSFAVHELEKLLKKENIELEALSKVQVGQGKISLRKQNKERNEYRNSIKKFKNTIYVPTWPSKKTKVEHDWTKLKDWDYYYFNLNIYTHDAKYIASFLNSDIGRLQFKYLAFGQFIKQLTSQSVKKLKIPVKNIDDQKISISTHKKIEILENNLDKIKKDSVYKPQQIDADILFADIPDHKINKLVKSEESEIHEYKPSIRVDLGKKGSAKEQYVSEAWLKTIAAFLNSKGGNLIIGVSDDKKILGLEHDDFKSQDDAHKFIVDKIKSKIGLEFLEKYISIKFLTVEKKIICHIHCAALPNDLIAFLGQDIYVRRGPSSRNLSPKEVADWQNVRRKN